MRGRRQFHPAVGRSRLAARRSSWTGLGAVVVATLACLAVVALALASKTSASSVEPSRAAPATAYVSGGLPLPVRACLSEPACPAGAVGRYARSQVRTQTGAPACCLPLPVRACLPRSTRRRQVRTQTGAQAGEAGRQAGWCPGATLTPRPGTQPRAFLPLVLGRGREKPACAPECVEPNDDPFHACPVAGPGSHCGEMRPYQAQEWPYEDLSDWYRLDVGCAFTLTVQLDGPDDAGFDGLNPAEFDLYVYRDPAGYPYPLTWSKSPGADESLRLQVEPGTYYVVPMRMQGTGTYKLSLGRLP